MDQRAQEIPKLYRNKAQNIDRKYCGAVIGQIGPLEQRLQDFGEISCLVAGQYGEASLHFHDLLKKLAVSKASLISQTEGRRVLMRPIISPLHPIPQSPHQDSPGAFNLAQITKSRPTVAT